MKVGLVVPVLYNFEGFTKLIKSVDIPVQPFVIPNWETNKGVAASWNIGLDLAIENKCDYLFIINDDVEMEPGSMAKMVEAVKDADLVSAIGGHSDQTGFFEIVDNGSPDFACFVIKPKEFLEKFDYFDEGYYPAYFEDNDMRYRIKIAGGKQGIVMDAPMVHGVSVTQNWNGDRVVSHERFNANAARYRFKWGGMPGEETKT